MIQEMIPIIMFFCGFFVGIALVGGLVFFRKKDSEKLKSEIKDTFSSLSLDVLQKNTDQLLKLSHETLGQKMSLASTDLESKKALIDKTLENIENQIKEVQSAVSTAEKNHSVNSNLLREHLELSKQSTESLRETTGKLHEVLANTKKRGEWGERMAEDVLRVVGLREGINYSKQVSHTNEEGEKSRPDYTFFLPQDLHLNMDVKFPFDNYLKYLESEAETDKESAKQQFFKDVKNRIKEVTSRDYINSETVDYCLIFIPNEQVYSFLQQEVPQLFDEALRQKVVVASPTTLYAVLAIVRQAVDNFSLGKSNREILKNLTAFKKQWNAFIEALQKVGKRIADTQKEYDSLVTTRKNQLERPLNQLESLGEGEMIQEESESKEVIES